MSNGRVYFKSRSYQRPMREARRLGCRNFLCLWHRRAGKDRSAATFGCQEMLQRPGVYFHIFPALIQARVSFWDNQVEEVDEKGRTIKLNMVDACFPPEIVKRKDDKEMQIELKERAGGGLYRFMGCEDDNAVERFRGANCFGVVSSEFAHGRNMKKALDVLAPVLAENGGWQALIYTPHGANHGQDAYNNAVSNQFSVGLNPLGWFVQKLTVEDTRKDAVGEAGSPVVTPDMIAADIKNGARPEFIRQEYWCDFTGFEHATVYGDLVRAAEESGCITEVGYVVNHPVGVLFDLGSGKSDAMAMWFYQRINGMTRFIDYEESTQKNMAWAAQRMREGRPYQYGRIVLPWDGAAAAEYLTEIGFHNVQVAERTKSVQMSIEQVRREFPTFVFDRVKCQRGVECLRRYTRKYDEERQVFEAPIHDQYSHGADALRTGVEGGFDPLVFPGRFTDAVRVYMDFDPRISI